MLGYVKYHLALNKLEHKHSGIVVLSEEGYIAETRSDMAGLNPASSFMIIELDPKPDVVVTSDNCAMYCGELSDFPATRLGITELASIKCLPKNLYVVTTDEVWFDEGMEDKADYCLCRILEGDTGRLPENIGGTSCGT